MQLADLIAAPDNPMPLKALSGYMDLVRDLGGDPALLLGTVSLTPGQIERDGDSTISVALIGKLLEQSAQAVRCSDFGMRLAERQSANEQCTPLYRLVTNAPTLLDAFEWSISHSAAYTTAVRSRLIYLKDSESFVQRFYFAGEGPVLFRQFVEMIILLAHNAVLELTGGAVRARDIWLSHPQISSRENYRERFGIVPSFSCDFDGLFYKEDHLNFRLLDNDPDVFQQEKTYVERAFPPSPLPFDVSARETMKSLLGVGECTRSALAHALGISERALGRRFEKNGYTFERARDEVRRNLAVKYLLFTKLSCTEVAVSLGYAEPAVFSRSCRRWFGLTPTEFRQRLAGHGDL